MNPSNTLVLIGHKTDTVRKAKALGLDVILLQHKSKLEPEQAALADATFVVDYRDWSLVRPLVETAHRTWGVAAALSLTGPGKRPARPGWNRLRGQPPAPRQMADAPPSRGVGRGHDRGPAG